MKDIALYGHLTIDTILDGDTEKKTLGSMANVWKALLEALMQHSISVYPLSMLVKILSMWINLLLNDILKSTSLVSIR